jgi:hypothetical protein
MSGVRNVGRGPAFNVFVNAGRLPTTQLATK